MSRKTRVDITYALVGRGQKTMLKEREPLDIQKWYSILGEAVRSVGEMLCVQALRKKTITTTKSSFRGFSSPEQGYSYVAAAHTVE